MPLHTQETRQKRAICVQFGENSGGGHVSSFERGGPLAWEVHWHGGGGYQKPRLTKKIPILYQKTHPFDPPPQPPPHHAEIYQKPQFLTKKPLILPTPPPNSCQKNPISYKKTQTSTKKARVSLPKKKPPNPPHFRPKTPPNLTKKACAQPKRLDNPNKDSHQKRNPILTKKNPIPYKKKPKPYRERSRFSTQKKPLNPPPFTTKKDLVFQPKKTIKPAPHLLPNKTHFSTKKTFKPPPIYYQKSFYPPPPPFGRPCTLQPTTIVSRNWKPLPPDFDKHKRPLRWNAVTPEGCVHACGYLGRRACLWGEG